MTKKDAQVVDIIIRVDEHDDSVNVAIFGGNLEFGAIYKALENARLKIQTQEINMVVEKAIEAATRGDGENV